MTEPSTAPDGLLKPIRTVSSPSTMLSSWIVNGRYNSVTPGSKVAVVSAGLE